MPVAHHACPLCAGTVFRSIPTFSHHHLVRCRSCGFVLALQEPTGAELDSYYSGYPIKQGNAITLKRYDELLDLFEPYRRNNLILDVGCGAGDLLARARERGWQVHGTEYGDAFIAACTQRGITMQQGPLDAKNYGEMRFDVVVSFEVLEHLPRPMEMLRNAEQVLRPGGLFYLTTPNYDALSRHLGGSGWNVVNYPEHLSFFTTRTLHRAFSALGLERVTMRTTGISITRLRTSRGLGEEKNITARNDDEVLRERLEGSPAMRFVKNAVNGTLNLFRMGDTLKATYRKPAQ